MGPEPLAKGRDMLVRIESFGYLHGAAPEGATLVMDLRRSLYDPHFDPAMKHLTAEHYKVLAHVSHTPGAAELVTQVLTLADTLARLTDDANRARIAKSGGIPAAPLVTVAFGCAGGRHRAAGMAILTEQALTAAGFEVELVHRDIDKPVVERTQVGAAVLAAA